MISFNNAILKFVLFATFSFSGILSHALKAQVIYGERCKRFLNAEELYVLDEDYNNVELTTSDGRKFTFYEIVKETWSNKKVIKIDFESYVKLKNAGDKFYISIENWPTRHGDFKTGDIYVIRIEAGRLKFTARLLYRMAINFEEMQEGILSERLIYGVQNIKSMLENYQDGSYRHKGVYKFKEYKQYFKENTLYLRKDQLELKYEDPAKIQKAYPYNFKIVTDDEWREVVKSGKEGVLYIDMVKTTANWTKAINIYHAQSGKLIIGSYGGITVGLLGKVALKKIAK